MTRVPRLRCLACASACVVVLCGVLAAAAGADATSTVTVTLAGTGTGTVSSDSPGFACSGSTCTGSFDPTATVVLTAAPAPGNGFAGFTGDCASTTATTCTLSPVAAAQVTATFDAPPILTVTAPADTDYAQGTVPAAAFTCPGATCSVVVDNGPAIASGDPLPGTPGAHSFTVTATASDGGSASQSGTYTVSAPPATGHPVAGNAPQVVISAPVDNAAYVWTAVPAADFQCVAGIGSTVQSCRATVGGQTISDHQPLPNGFGVHVLTVTATDADGLATTSSATYTATSSVDLPPVSIDAPAQGRRYRLGQVVAARYSCLAPTIGPALRSCVGTVRAGRPINTRTLGRHRFSVSATNAQGTSTTESVSYAVVPTTNRFVVTGVRARHSGVLRLGLKLPGPGSVKVAALAWNVASGASRRRIVYALVRARARHGGPLGITVTPSAAGRALRRMHGARPVVLLGVAYRPIGGKVRARVLKPLRFG